MTAPLVLTPGEPAGIGPEITAGAWEALRKNPSQNFFALTDAAYFSARLPHIPAQIIEHPRQAAAIFSNAIPILHRPMPMPSQTGKLDAMNSPWVIAAIEEAVKMCDAKVASAIVTNPIQKEILYAVGFKFQGHTDFLANLAGRSGQDVMMLVGESLRSVPVTVHIPLSEVPKALTTAAIVSQGKTVVAALIKYFGISNPRVAVTGLNPHAGENGAIGLEDQTIVAPAVAQLRSAGIAVHGPLPADTAFHPEARATYDAILCMYHDQALIPVKTLDFHGGVNVTLGLPFIRTSPDHGTALNLAGTGKANPSSLIAAIKLASSMAAQNA
jgi:4-hydroxythreonine-4-phosphate dehydrogenase